MRPATILMLAWSTAVAGCYQPYTPNYPTTYASARPTPTIERGPSECAEWLTSARDIQLPQLYESIRRAGLKKSQYETTAEFNEKSREVLAKQSGLLSDVGGEKRVVVSVPMSGLYNADTGRLKIYTQSFFGNLFDKTFVITDDLSVEDKYVFADVRSSEAVAGRYIGSNAFGTTRQVTSYSGITYGVALTDISRQRQGWNEGHKDLSLALSPDRAKALKSTVAVKLIGELEPPGTILGKVYQSPTISNPNERRSDDRYVTMRTVCAAFIAPDTGEILLRLK